MREAATICPRPLQVDLWPFDLESGVRVTCDVGYLCANFSLPRPLCSRLRPDVRDRQTTEAHRRLLKWRGMSLVRKKHAKALSNKFVRPRWPYDMRPSARAQKYMCHCNSLGGATWRSVMITGRMDRQTDGQRDRQTDRQSATQYTAPS